MKSFLGILLIFTTLFESLAARSIMVPEGVNHRLFGANITVPPLNVAHDPNVPEYLEHLQRVGDQPLEARKIFIPPGTRHRGLDGVITVPQLEPSLSKQEYPDQLTGLFKAINQTYEGYGGYISQAYMSNFVWEINEDNQAMVDIDVNLNCLPAQNYVQIMGQILVNEAAKGSEGAFAQSPVTNIKIWDKITDDTYDQAKSDNTLLEIPTDFTCSSSPLRASSASLLLSIMIILSSYLK